MPKRAQPAAPLWRNRVKELRYLSPRDLDDHPLQHKAHPDQQRSVMRGVLQEIGMADVLLAYVSPRTGRLTAIDGHLRKSLGEAPWPTAILDVDDAEAAYILAVGDEVTSLALKEQDALARLLHEVQSGDSAVQQLLSELAQREGLVPPDGISPGATTPGADVEPQIDRADELRQQWGVEVGQLWACGTHYVICGDCTDKVVVERLMQGQTADMVFTDPPYNVSSASRNYAADAPTQKKTYEALKHATWDQNFDIASVFPVLDATMAHDCAVYICTSHWLVQRVWEWMWGWSDFCSYNVWCKPNPAPSLAKRHWTWATELIAYAVRGTHVCNFPHEGHALNWWEIVSPTHSTGHPTEKPVAIPQRAIEFSSHAGSLVYDGFLGSGTTLIACENLGRTCYGVEINPGYTAVTLERFMQLTGIQPVLMQ